MRTTLTLPLSFNFKTANPLWVQLLHQSCMPLKTPQRQVYTPLTWPRQCHTMIVQLPEVRMNQMEWYSGSRTFSLATWPTFNWYTLPHCKCFCVYFTFANFVSSYIIANHSVLTVIINTSTGFVEVETEIKLTCKDKVVKYHHKKKKTSQSFSHANYCSTTVISIHLLCTALCSCWLPCV